MHALWLSLLVVLVCVEAQSLMEVKGNQGEDVALSCTIRRKDVYWYMEVHNQLKAYIGRSFSSYSSYSSPDFESKYLIQESRLVIRTITADDCILYFCAEKKSHNITVVDTIRLMSDVPVPPSHLDEQECSTRGHVLLVYRSAIVVFVLVSLVSHIVLVVTCLKRRSNQMER